MATTARIAQIARILADEGLGGNQFERLVIRIADTEPEVVNVQPQAADEPLADWEKELLAGTPGQWCALFIDRYTDERANFLAYPNSKIGMIKDVRNKFGIGLKDAKDEVEAAQSNKALAALRARLMS